MSIYIPPALNAVDFALSSFTPANLTPVTNELTAYVPPALTAVDFALTAYTPPSGPYVGWELLPGASPVTGTVAVALEGITPAITGRVRIAGTMALALQGITPAVIGKVVVSGNSAVALQGITPAITGTVSTSAVSGSLAITLDGIVPAFNGTVVTPQVIYPGSGGDNYVFRRVRDRDDLADDAIEVIEAVAQRQADDLHLDEQQRLDELKGELQLKRIEMRTFHIELLNLERQRIIDEEIGKRLQAIQQTKDEEAIMFILAAIA